MSGTLDRAIAESEEQAKAERITSERYVIEQQMLEEQAPVVWQQFRSAVKAECGCRPDHLVFAVTPNTEAAINTVQAKGRKTLVLRYLPKSKAVSFVCAGKAGSYPIRLNAVNVAVLCTTDGEEFESNAEAAEQVLSLLFR
ncbi:MAG: hypothetical protein ACLGPM_03130 [Acidobacteriota bacterium]